MDGAVIQSAGQEPDRPRVRQDLNLYVAGEHSDGEKIWHLHDPLSNRFFQLQESDVELLALIGHKTASQISEEANRIINSNATEEEVEQLFHFLRENNLVVADDAQLSFYSEALAKSKHQLWWQQALRNPVFFRIPLWNPDRFLDATLPYVAWMGSKANFAVMIVIALLGAYLVLQQLELFFKTFLHFFNLSGLVVYLVALFVVKVFHELGHAYTAKHLGCKVPTIGVAFMVGWPIFFTDTSDAWKIPEKRKRIRIGVAGVSVELAIAVVSLFLWSVTPEGPLRSIFFLLSTTTWLLSVFVNFNPLMRFDGYYLLSDILDVPNLEQRSFGLARWWLREKIFGFGISPPEEPRKALVVYAFMVWNYRFFLFLGIALLVYGFFFKAAGIVLFIVEIIYFIVRPVIKELREWWQLKDQVRMTPSLRRTLAVICLAGLILFVPWSNDVVVPTTVEARSNDLYLPVPGRLIKRSGFSKVNADDLMFLFESPELELEIDEVKNRYEELRWIRASQGFDSELRNEALIVESELTTQGQRLRTLVEQANRLSVNAPFDGEVVDISPELIPGDWLPAGQRLATVVDRSELVITAYLPEAQLGRIEEGMTARFYPENPEHGIRDLVVSEIEFMGTPELDNPYVASTFGGDVAVRQSEEGELLTVQSQYKVVLSALDSSWVADQVVRGSTVIEGKRLSLFSQIKRRFVAVFIRETGF